MANQRGAYLLNHMSKAQRCREDTTALLLAKMVAIATDNTRPFMRMLDELREDDTRERAENVICTLVGYIVQLTESGGMGYLKLCTSLVDQLVNHNLEDLPMETRWR